jgi:hypothetical protein
VWEMPWSFAGPDGRATSEWVTIDAEPAIRWRRVGSHAIFSDPRKTRMANSELRAMRRERDAARR